MGGVGFTEGADFGVVSAGVGSRRSRGSQIRHRPGRPRRSRRRIGRLDGRLRKRLPNLFGELSGGFRADRGQPLEFQATRVLRELSGDPKADRWQPVQRQAAAPFRQRRGGPFADGLQSVEPQHMGVVGEFRGHRIGQDRQTVERQTSCACPSAAAVSRLSVIRPFSSSSPCS